eukprot:297632-Amphidinium_carterae.1
MPVGIILSLLTRLKGAMGSAGTHHTSGGWSELRLHLNFDKAWLIFMQCWNQLASLKGAMIIPRL